MFAIRFVLTGIAAVLTCIATDAAAEQFDVLIRNGTVYDGSGSAPVRADVAVDGDRIASIGDHENDSGGVEIDAAGLAVAPGFVNMLSHATTSLIVDGRSQGDIRQGVTLEVFGESSMGPLNNEMKEGIRLGQGDLEYEVEWTTLGEYLEFLERKGVSPNVASFVGASTIRVHVIGREDRPPTDTELIKMRELVRQAMKEGAMGVTSALIYAPASYASTEELVALCEVASEYDGMFIAHMRSEGDRLLEAVDEMIAIAKEAELPVEIYHLKAAGKTNWDKLDDVIEKVEQARADGVEITADMYLYTAGATGLDAAMPLWVQEGGYSEWAERLRDPEIRARVEKEMNAPGDDWENLYYAAGSPDKLLFVGFRNDELKPLIGKTLAEVAELRGKSPAQTAMDLVVEDGSRVSTVYFLMSEENVKKQIALPWVSFGSDGSSMATEGDFLKSNTHPRAYGNVPRLLGKYVREEKVIPLEEAIRKLTSLPATNLKIRNRGFLKKGYFADVVVFDPDTIADHATFEEPHQYSTGMVHVFVNGEHVLRNGEHTGATPGRVVRGPGWNGK